VADRTEAGPLAAALARLLEAGHDADIGGQRRGIAETAEIAEFGDEPSRGVLIEAGKQAGDLFVENRPRLGTGAVSTAARSAFSLPMAVRTSPTEPAADRIAFLAAATLLRACSKMFTFSTSARRPARRAPADILCRRLPTRSLRHA
jgi:hypothetical protein